MTRLQCYYPFHDASKILRVQEEPESIAQGEEDASSGRA
jgi:hypothetical protein